MTIKPIVQQRGLHYHSLSKHAQQDIRGIIYRIYNTYNGKSYITYETGESPTYPIWYKLVNGQYQDTIRNFQVDYDNHMTSFKIEWLSVFYDEDDLDAQIRHFRLFYGGIQELLLYNVKENRRFVSKTQALINKNEAMISELQEKVFSLTTELNQLKAKQSEEDLVSTNITTVSTEELFKEITARSSKKPKELLLLLNKVQSDILFKSLDIVSNTEDSFNIEETKNENSIKDETEDTNKNDIFYDKHSKKSNKGHKQKNGHKSVKINLSNLSEEDARQLILANWKDDTTNTTLDDTLTNTTNVSEQETDIVPEEDNSFKDDSSFDDVSKWETAPAVEEYDEYNATIVNGNKLFDMTFEMPLKTVLSNDFFWYDGSMPIMKWFDIYRRELRKYPNFYKQLKEEVNFCNNNYNQSRYKALVLYLKGATIEEMQQLLNKDKPMANVDSLQNSLPAIYLVSGCGAKANRKVKGKTKAVYKRCVDILKGFGVDDIPEVLLESFSPRSFHTTKVVSIQNLDDKSNIRMGKNEAYFALKEKISKLSKEQQDEFYSMLKEASKKIS